MLKGNFLQNQSPVFHEAWGAVRWVGPFDWYKAQEGRAYRSEVATVSLAS